MPGRDLCGQQRIREGRGGQSGRAPPERLGKFGQASWVISLLIIRYNYSSGTPNQEKYLFQKKIKQSSSNFKAKWEHIQHTSTPSTPSTPKKDQNKHKKIRKNRKKTTKTHAKNIEDQ